MASDVIQTVEVSLEDGTKIVLKPLVIRRLKKFLKAWKAGFEKVNYYYPEDGPSPVEDDEDKPTVDDLMLETYINCSAIALSEQLKGKIDKVDQFDNPKEFIGPKEEYIDYLEDNIDVEVAKKIAEVCGGIVAEDDPKVMDAAMRALQEQSGTTS